MENNNVPKKPSVPTNGNVNKPISPAKPSLPKASAQSAGNPQVPNKPQAPVKPSASSPIKPSMPNQGGARPQAMPATPKTQPVDIDKDIDFRENVPEKKIKDKSLSRYAKADRRTIKQQMKINARINKKRMSVNRPFIKNKKEIKPTYQYVKPAKLYGNLIYEVAQARKRAIIGGLIVVKKKKRRLFLIILLLIILFSTFAGSSYILLDRIMSNQSDIKEGDVDFVETDKRDFETNAERGYIPGNYIERLLRINNASKNVGLYVAYKFTIKQDVGGTLVDVDLEAEPYLSGEPDGHGNTSEWTVGRLSTGEIFYYSNEILSSEEGKNQLALFEKYKLNMLNGYDENHFADMKVKVVVTVYVLEEGYTNITLAEDPVWREAPVTWTAIMRDKQ